MQKGWLFSHLKRFCFYQIHKSYTFQTASYCAKSWSSFSCGELCRCERCGAIYSLLLFHRVHKWWECIWEMYESCNLLPATTKVTKLIKCGQLDVSPIWILIVIRNVCENYRGEYIFGQHLHLWGSDPWSKRINNVQMIQATVAFTCWHSVIGLRMQIRSAWLEALHPGLQLSFLDAIDAIDVFRFRR